MACFQSELDEKGGSCRHHTWWQLSPGPEAKVALATFDWRESSPEHFEYNTMKILFILPSNIGDIVLASPAIALARQHHPQALFYIMLGTSTDNSYSFSLFENAKKFYEQVFVYSKKSKWRKKIRLIKDLRQHHFDEIIDLKNSFLSFLLAGKNIKNQLLLKIYWVILKNFMGYKKKYVAFFYFDLLKKIGFQGEFKFEVFPSIPNMVETYDIRFNPNKKIILISPGSKNMTKRWSQDYYTRVIYDLLKNGKYQIILVGDESDRPIIDNMMIHFLDDINVINLCTKTTLSELYNLIRKSNLVITNDSAPLHLAAAANVPSLAIFGPSDYKKYAPPFSNHTTVMVDLECSPCERSLCRYDIAKPPCMINITPREILKKIYASV